MKNKNFRADVEGQTASKGNANCMVEAFASIIDWMMEMHRRVKFVTEYENPEKVVLTNYFSSLNPELKHPDKYRYCYGDKDQERSLDEVERYLEGEGVLFGTYVLRQVFILCKNGLTGTFTIFVDDEFLVKFEINHHEGRCYIKTSKAPNMQELIRRVQ